MTLSIVDAARDAATATAVHDGATRVSFAALAARAAATALPSAALGHAAALVAHTDLATVAALAAALERRQPLGLLAPRATAADHADQRARLAATPVPPDTAFVVFTSGSTGRAKAVVLSRAAALGAAAISAAHLGWRDDDAWLAPLPLAHVAGLAIVVRCLVARRAIVLGDAAMLADPRVTLASLVPTQLAQRLDDPAWRPSPRLRAILLGGAAAAPALVARARARGLPIVTTYGMTETFGQVATGDATTPPDAIGRALPGVTLVGGTATAPAPLAVRSPALMTGYLDEPTPLREGGFVTRDLGYLDADGVLRVLGRADDVIITGGENVYPAAIEAALTALPGVLAAAVAGVPDAQWGERVAAAIVVAPAIDRAALTAALATWPPHLRPRTLIELDALPLTATGKLDRRAVTDHLRGRSDRADQPPSPSLTPNAAR